MPRKKINEALLSDNQNSTKEVPTTNPAETPAPAPKQAAQRKKAEGLPSQFKAEEPAPQQDKKRAPRTKAASEPAVTSSETVVDKPAAKAKAAKAKPVKKAAEEPKTPRSEKASQPKPVRAARAAKAAPQKEAEPSAPPTQAPAKKALFGRPSTQQSASADSAKARQSEAAKPDASQKDKPKTAPPRSSSGRLFPAATQQVEAKPAAAPTPAVEYVRHNEQILSALVEDDGTEIEVEGEEELDVSAVLKAVLRVPVKPDKPAKDERPQPREFREKGRGRSREERRPHRREALETEGLAQADLPPLTDEQKEALDAGQTLVFAFRSKPGPLESAASKGRFVSEDEIIAALADGQDLEPSDIPPLVTEILVGAWRTKDGEVVQAPSPATSKVEDQRERRKSWKERRAERTQRKAEAVKADEELVEDEAEVQPEAPAPPAKKERTRISVPVDAPQIVLHQGVPTLISDRKIIPPLFLYLGGPTPNQSQIEEEVRTAAECGVHSIAFPVKLEVSAEGVDTALYMAKQKIETLLEANPEARFVLQVCFTFPSGWDSDHPDARWKAPKEHEPRPSFCDDGLWQKAEDSLAKFIKEFQACPHGSRLLGIHLDRHSWHYLDDEGYDDSQAARRKFGLWLRHRYGNDLVSLRASWFDGRVTFDDVFVPNYAKRHGSENDFVRLDRRARRWVDYNLFLSDSLVDRISSIAYAAKSAGEGRILVGVSYGYTFEWSHPASGHLSLGKLLRSAEIDYISGPSSYSTRQPGQTAAFPWPIDSFLLNGKLAVFEEDFRTPIGKSDEDDRLPLMKTPQALEAAHWRGAGAALAHGGGLNWMDMRGQGWLNSRGIWERGSKVLTALNWRVSSPMKDPDVALMIDERSLAYLADPRAFEELVQDVREALLRSGMSVGFYLLSDLAHRENFPDARLFIFVNAWDIRPEVRSSIKARLQKEEKVLFWLYSAGLFEGGRESLERAREATGIALRPQPFNSKPGTNLVNLRDPLCRTLPNDMMAEGGTLEPSYFAIPEDATVLGEYIQTGLPSFVVRKFPSPNTNDEPWTSVFLGEPVVTPGLFKALGQMAGCHIYSLDDDVIHVSAPFLSLHCAGAGVRTINLPDKWTCYDLIQRVWMPVENNTLKFLGLDGSTYSFLIGHKADIELLISSPPETMVTEEEILAHQDNTVRWDAIRFDVPIMKLDEWVEETWGEDLADDLLIKPSMIEEIGDESLSDVEREAPRSSGQRRKKKRTTTKGRQDPGQQAQEQAQKVNFLFRKRE